MKPIAIFRHLATEGPGYFATFLEAHSLAWRLFATDRGEPVPTRAEEFAGLVFMGGPMSVNDPLPWIAEECTLIRDAVAHDIPVLGHCLGSQLMSRALGGSVFPNPQKEIGWSCVVADDTPTTRRWLGEATDDLLASDGSAVVFQWHGETFTLPEGSERLFSNAFCANQMFALGPHLGMQCHVEMTEPMIAEWCQCWNDETAGLASLPVSVQTPEVMQAQAATQMPAMRRLADRLYTHWIAGLKP
ncbi:type 1 glutamine amidotransferase [Rhodocyclus tenuis]|uniref:Type 1 glutamine amidotransferase n=1 Tax=Rhodocyclus gracilis TaxID=2929842 RepID=A0ABX0WFF2_9RHOO|nr:type 1 glutamine amidotransferase [Rhodocyclus gracilis]NJA88011.1 type 1 glutamine amidotransferase [Rhodocyclus gracilis]